MAARSEVGAHTSTYMSSDGVGDLARSGRSREKCADRAGKELKVRRKGKAGEGLASDVDFFIFFFCRSES